MFKKTTIAAVAIATAIAAPVTAANATGFGFHFSTPHGHFSFGNAGGYYPHPQPLSLSCWQAKQHLKAAFKHVNTVECNGNIYTFKVKKFNVSPWKTVKLNKHNGDYWYA